MSFYEHSVLPSPPAILLSQTEIATHLLAPVQLMRHRQLPRQPRHSPYPKQGPQQQHPMCQGLLLRELVPVATPMIEKPPGEAGRPGRGGYNLEKTLGWDSKTLAAVKACFLTYSEISFHRLSLGVCSFLLRRTSGDRH